MLSDRLSVYRRSERRPSDLFRILTDLQLFGANISGPSSFVDVCVLICDDIHNQYLGFRDSRGTDLYIDLAPATASLMHGGEYNGIVI